MHILFITIPYPTSANPINAVFIQEHARAVSELHQVSLLHVVGQDRNLKKAYIIERQVENRRLNIFHLRYRRLPIPKSGWISQGYGAMAVFDQAALEFGTPDLIHANMYETAFLGYLLKKLRKVPVVLSEHSSAYPRRLFKPGQLEIARFFMNRLDWLLPVSADLENHMKHAGIIGRFEVIPNVVNAALFHPPQKVVSPQTRPITPLGIIVAGLSPVKRIELALSAIEGMKRTGIKVRLRIIGDGTERANLESIAKSLEITDYVDFEGFLPKSQIAEHLRQADFFVLSSRWENLPVALLEALATGLPILAPAVGGIPEIFSLPGAPPIGRLFKPGDLLDMQTQMRTLLENLSCYDRQNISQFAQEQFGVGPVSVRLDKIYKNLKENPCE